MAHCTVVLLTEGSLSLPHGSEVLFVSADLNLVPITLKRILLFKSIKKINSKFFSHMGADSRDEFDKPN